MLKLTKMQTLRETPVRIQAPDGNWSEELDAHVLKQIASAFDRFESRISRIDVALTDTNGPRGGIDQRCRVQVYIVPRGQITVSADATSGFAAVSAAISRAQNSLVRELTRRMRRRRTRQLAVQN